MIRRALILLLFTAMPLCAASETDRLVTLCHVWATAKYLHPAAAFGDVDWDAALIRAISRVRASKTDAELASAVGAMLAELRDPATRIVEARSQQDAPLFRWDGDVLVVSAGAYAANHSSAIWSEIRKLAPEIQKAKGVLFDVRFHPDDPADFGDVAGAIGELALSKVAIAVPPKQYVFHSGYTPQEGSTSGGYYSAVLTIPGKSVEASQGAVPPKIVFVTDSASPLPDAALALRQAGTAFIVSEDPIEEAMDGQARMTRITPTAFAAIQVATSIPMHADVVTSDPIVEGLAILRHQKPEPNAAPSAVQPVSLTPRWKPDPAYAEMTYPDEEHRILAAFRIWSVINFFYPYKPLIGDWQSVLPEFIPRFIAAANADQYAAAVLEMVARVEDGHSGAYGHPSYKNIIGDGIAPIEVRLIENQFVITRIGPEVPKGAQLHLGDIVLAVDGEPFRARVERMRKFLTASTERARVNRVARGALAGAKGSDAAIEVQGADGAKRVVRLPRVAFGPPPPSEAPPFRKINDRIGYVDLTRLTRDQVDAMFDALWTTDAIIFDMRGYPNGTAWPIAPRINTRGAKVGATFRRAEFSGASTAEEAQSGFFFDQSLPTSSKPVYKGKTVMLIDDRAISQAEHTCLFFEAASGPTFIGSSTAGANGDVTNFTLPGGFTVYFTGHDVRHADGRQLQRVGIKPDIEVEPTIRGIREGRDEVLDRAIQYLNSGRGGGATGFTNKP